MLTHRLTSVFLFPSLLHLPYGSSEEQENPKEPEELETFSSVRLSLKSFSRFLSSYVVETATIMCLCSGQCVIFYVYIGDISNYKGCMTVSYPDQEEREVEIVIWI